MKKVNDFLVAPKVEKLKEIFSLTNEEKKQIAKKYWIILFVLFIISAVILFLNPLSPIFLIQGTFEKITSWVSFILFSTISIWIFSLIVWGIWKILTKKWKTEEEIKNYQEKTIFINALLVVIFSEIIGAIAFICASISFIMGWNIILILFTILFAIWSLIILYQWLVAITGSNWKILLLFIIIFLIYGAYDYKMEEYNKKAEEAIRKMNEQSERTLKAIEEVEQIN